jgi:acetyl esterase
VARRLRDLGGPPLRAQVLVYPVTDLLGSDREHPSRSSNGSGFVLTTATMDFFADQFVPDPARRAEPDASPLRAEDLSGLPPALVLTAEYDPLRDEGEAYAAALRGAGVEVTSARHDGTIHLFVQLSTTQACRRAIDQIASFMAERV